MKRTILSVFFLASLFALAQGQQVPDTAYKPYIAHPAYPPGKGQLICIDEGHNNFHTRGDRYLLLLSDTAWVFNERTVYKPIAGWSQLAFMEYGKGRVVMSGEAAMFTAQLAGAQHARVGMNSPYAKETTDCCSTLFTG